MLLCGYAMKSYLLVASLLLGVLADVKFVSPLAGSTITSTTIYIAWEESGAAPLISDLGSYAISLCAGGNDPDDYVRQRTI